MRYKEYVSQEYIKIDKMVGTEKYTIVMAIKQKTYDNTNNFERFVRVSMPTYEAFLDVASVQEFIIIAPTDELKTFSHTLTSMWPSWPWRFVAEDKLLDKTLNEGWARQQTAKLAISMLVTTDHYLIVDDDTYLTRSFAYKNLFDNEGKVILTRTLIDFPFFFLWSNQVLQYDIEEVQKEPYHMAITPEIFVTSEARGLVKWLVSTYGDNKLWQKHLQNNKFTEYCLYWIWLIKQNKHKQLYSTSPDAHSMYGHATTSDVHDLKENIQKSFDSNEKHYFSFVQTSLGHPLDRIVNEIKPYLA